MLKRKREEESLKIKGLTEVNIEEIKERGKFKLQASKILMKFQDMQAKAVKVDVNVASPKEFGSLYNALKHVIKKEDIPVEVLQREGELYLIKK